MEESRNEEECPEGSPDGLVLITPGQEYVGKQGHSFFVGISRESAGSRGLCMHQVVIPPGARDHPHLHEGHETAIFVISGEAEGRYGEGLSQRLVAGAGSFVYIPAGVPHQAINASATEPLVAVIARTDPHEQESVVLLGDERQLSDDTSADLRGTAP
ncbi:cupin domain-containing protein [Streptomyces sp. NPDC057271]|uniref:cupin domain-containing protein n=1 Tax=unclassified Streptomyces TaxID=2593676 RepID=UPI00362A98F5